MADDHETDEHLEDETDEEDDGEEDPVRFDEWVEAVQSEVAYCATCQPYDSCECVWIFGEEMSGTTSSTKVSKLVKFGSQVSVSGSGLRRTMAGSGERGV